MFAAPLFVWIAAAAAIVTVGLHLLAWRRPPESPLPTARFAPDAPIRIVSRAVRPADIALLALRVVMVMLVGAAVGGPSFATRGRGIGRVVVVDRSRTAVGPVVVDAGRRELRPGDALVVFDSAAREVRGSARDSLIASRPTVARGSVSAALIAGIRAADRLEREHESVEIVMVSPFATEELDAATAAIRRTWAGTVRLVRAGGPPNANVLARPDVRASTGDAVAAALSLASHVWGGANVRVVRDGATAVDSSWAREGRTLVVWPSPGGPSERRRQPSDSAFAVSALRWVGGGTSASSPATVVARFVRETTPPPGRVVARWEDGEPAASEVALGAGCMRAVAVTVPAAGDLALTPAFRRFAERMASPCEGGSRWVAASDSVLNSVLPASSPPGVPGGGAATRAGAPRSRLAVWLLGGALIAALAELFVRRGANATA